MIANPEQSTRLDAPPATETAADARRVRASAARAASGRRRNIDPTTCERDYRPAELEFMQAIQDYKTRSGRKHPTWGEALEVLVDLGYQKQP